jgi:hypothetical protein
MRPGSIDNQENYSAARLITAFEELSPEDRVKVLKDKGFKEWMQNDLQLPSNNSARIVAVMRHEKFRKLVQRYSSIQYGRRSFNWTIMCKIICSKLDCVSIEKGIV